MNYLNKIKFIGKGLNRPECVLVDPENTLHVSDFQGGVKRILESGDIKFTKPNLRAWRYSRCATTTTRTRPATRSTSPTGRSLALR